MSKVGAKKPLFKKPAWASTSTKTTDSDEPIFGQAHLYQDIIQAEKQRRERHAARQKERTEKAEREAQHRESKRRRISRESEDSESDGESDAGSAASSKGGSGGSQRSATSVQEEAVQQVTDTPQRKGDKAVGHRRAQRLLQTRSQSTRPATRSSVNSLDDGGGDEDDKGPSGLGTRSKPFDPQQPVAQPESDSESEGDEDNYLRALKLKARQEAQRARSSGTEAEKEHGSDPPRSRHLPHTSSAAGMEQVSATGNSKLFGLSTDTTPSRPSEDDVEVKIWIKTIIPGAKELIVNRRVGQPLDKVREFWIKRNELDPGLAAKVFFTWNGMRLYNSSTMRGLIERLKKTHPTKDGSDPGNGHITIEAVTEEIFEYRQRQQARMFAEAQGQDDSSGNGHVSANDFPDKMPGTVTVTTAADQDDDEDDEDGRHCHRNSAAATRITTTTTSAAATTTTKDDGSTSDHHYPTTLSAAAPTIKPGIVIKLRAQAHDEVCLRVRPDTTMRKILAGFCKLKSISVNSGGGGGNDDNGNSWLSYDGDRLDPAATVDQVGLEHDDSVEVYLR